MKADRRSKDSEMNGMDHEERTRTSGRMKKAKIMYDPSDFYLSARQRQKLVETSSQPSKDSPSKDSQSDYGSSSQESPAKRSRPSLLLNGAGNQVCCVCKSASDEATKVSCSSCSSIFHIGCHKPRVYQKIAQRGNWKCRGCRADDSQPISQETSVENSRDPPESIKSNSASEAAASDAEDVENEFVGFHDLEIDQKQALKSGLGALTQQISLDKARQYFQRRGEQQLAAHMETNGDSIPDVSGWTCEQVYDYFVQFFPKEASIFRDQEIDGTSLLLMTRSDMFKFSLKLGPALNIYRYIVMLQSRTFDPRKTWF